MNSETQMYNWHNETQICYNQNGQLVYSQPILQQPCYYPATQQNYSLANMQPIQSMQLVYNPTATAVTLEGLSIQTTTQNDWQIVNRKREALKIL